MVALDVDVDPVGLSGDDGDLTGPRPLRTGDPHSEDVAAGRRQWYLVVARRVRVHGRDRLAGGPGDGHERLPEGWPVVVIVPHRESRSVSWMCCWVAGSVNSRISERGAHPLPRRRRRIGRDRGAPPSSCPRCRPRLQSTGSPSVLSTVTTACRIGRRSSRSTTPRTTTSCSRPSPLTSPSGTPFAGSGAPAAAGAEAAARCEDGKARATAAAAIEAAAAIQKMSWKASSDGRATPPTSMVTELRAAATAALAVDVPMARSNVFRPLAEAVSVIGTARMIRVGIAA